MTISPYLTLEKRTERQARMDRAARVFVRKNPVKAVKALRREDGWHHFAFGFVSELMRGYEEAGL